MNPFRVLDLFSGIGGFALGLERAGMSTVAFCEREPFARRVLRRHWPTVPVFEDVRTITGKQLRKEGITPNVIVGGFPCQDISCAGKGRGLKGERSGLWREMHRLVQEIRPAWVLAENVPALRTRGSDQVLADLEKSGYAAWPLVVGAWSVGAPHIRNRVWIVARDTRNRSDLLADPAGANGGPGPRDDAAAQHGRSDVANPDRGRRKARLAEEGSAGGVQSEDALRRGWWSVEPGVGRVADGVPHRLDRVSALGNAVVPAIVEHIGRAIVAHTQAGPEGKAPSKVTRGRGGRAA